GHHRDALDGDAMRLEERDLRVLHAGVLGEAAVLVALHERLRGAERDDAAQRQALLERDGALQAFLVEPERGVADAVAAADAVHHRLGVGPARHALGIDEGDDLDAPQAGLRQRIDERDLALGRDRPRLDLEALARALLMDIDPLRQIAHDVSPYPGLL